MDKRKLTNEEFKDVSLQILIEVDAFCKSHHLHYSLAYGTLIGAIRHKGYIPWDDDIDIVMLREDYKVFISEFGMKGRNRYYVASPESDENFPYTFAKVCDDTTICNDYGYDKQGVGIDLFPIDKLPLDDRETIKIIHRQHKLWNIFMMKMMKWRKGRAFVKNVIAIISALVFKLIPYSYLHKKLKVNAEANKDLQNYKLGCLYGPYGIKEVMDKHVFDSYINVEFEGYKFLCVSAYEKYLSHLYGDYMKLPPKEQRMSHHDFEAYYK